MAAKIDPKIDFAPFGSILAAILDFRHIGFSETVLNAIFELAIVENLYKDTILGIRIFILWGKSTKSFFYADFGGHLEKWHFRNLNKCFR